MKVLVVEDNKSASMIVCRIITSMGHDTVHAESGEEAVSLFNEGQYDLILMDVEMPGINGFEATQLIRKASPDLWVPIIFLSANTADTYLTIGIEAGGDDYLSKPVKPAVLKAKIQAMSRIAQMQEQLAESNKNLARANEELQLLSCMDGLTSVVNRRGFDSQFEVEWRRTLREMTPLSVLMIDVDEFKGFNDHYGHLAGDDCLRVVAQALKGQLLRPGDMVARYGGEEFVILLPNTNIEGAVNVAKNIQKDLYSANVDYPHSSVSDRVTICMGIYCTNQLDANFDRSDNTVLLARADKALYKAKKSGRNQYVVFESDATEGEVGMNKVEVNGVVVPFK
ncbi:hypothetical protein A9Q81_14335 [Gammaproteobacteria bacterium 42_54_T18]|nr:hypothetical protein A9Q81_14335 [Gammaproteobacteria bacterium 42_54_T18]